MFRKATTPMHRLPAMLVLLLLAACSALPDLTETMERMNTSESSESSTPRESSQPSGQRVVASLPDLGEAPELTNTVWLNTPGNQPLRLAALRGKVVLLDFWTFGCINCVHVIPSLREWHYQYGGEGLVVIGNHFPEFGHERDLNNLRDALERLNVPYAVAQDNDGKTWYAYGTRYWPTLILIDKRGHMRYQHIGEGRYAETEAAIVALLGETYP